MCHHSLVNPWFLFPSKVKSSSKLCINKLPTFSCHLPFQVSGLHEKTRGVSPKWTQKETKTKQPSQEQQKCPNSFNYARHEVSVVSPLTNERKSFTRSLNRNFHSEVSVTCWKQDPGDAATIWEDTQLGWKTVNSRWGVSGRKITSQIHPGGPGREHSWEQTVPDPALSHPYHRSSICLRSVHIFKLEELIFWSLHFPFITEHDKTQAL